MGDFDPSSIEVANVIDARGVSCPGPLLEAKKGIGTVNVGEVMEVMSNDPGSKNDVPRWAQKVGHEYLGYVSEEGTDRIFVRRKK